MTRDELRLECIKLAYVHGREPAQIVERAKALEEWISEKPPMDRFISNDKLSQKSVGNSQTSKRASNN